MQTDLTVPVTLSLPERLQQHFVYLVPSFGFALLNLTGESLLFFTLAPICLLMVVLQHQKQTSGHRLHQLMGLGIGITALTITSMVSKGEMAIILSIFGLVGSMFALWIWALTVNSQNTNESEPWFYMVKGVLSDKTYLSSTFVKLPMFIMSYGFGLIFSGIHLIGNGLTQVNRLPVGSLWKTIVQPMLFVGAFIVVYSFANVQFASSVELLFFPVYLMVDIYEYLILYSDIAAILTTTAITAFFIMPFSKVGIDLVLHNPFADSLKLATDSSAVQQPELDASVLHDDTIELDQSLEAFHSEATSSDSADKYLLANEVSDASQHDLSSMTPTLIALNTLLAWFHVVDIYGLLSLDWSHAPAWSVAVHDSMNGAILGTVSGLLLLTAKSIDWDNKDNIYWGTIWTYNNAFFAGMTLIKCAAYLFGFGYTDARTLVMALMIGILGSFLVGLRKLKQQQSTIWFMSRIVEVQYGCFVLATLVITLMNL